MRRLKRPTKTDARTHWLSRPADRPPRQEGRADAKRRPSGPRKAFRHGLNEDGPKKGTARAQQSSK